MNALARSGGFQQPPPDVHNAILVVIGFMKQRMKSAPTPRNAPPVMTLLTLQRATFTIQP